MTSAYAPLLVGRTGLTSERYNSRPRCSLKLDTIYGVDEREADRHHGCVCVTKRRNVVAWVGWTKGGWKDSRKVPHAALMHHGSAGPVAWHRSVGGGLAKKAAD